MIYVWLRPSVDWGVPERARAEVRPDLGGMIDLWNQTFNMTYQAFRQRVAEIADLNHASVPGSVRAEWDEIPDGELVVPVDDDDWFSPQMAKVLEEEREAGIGGYYWVGSWVEVPMHIGHRFHLFRRRLLPWTPPKYICATNGYAMAKSPEAKSLLVRHDQASAYFERWAKGEDGLEVRKIDQRLSVANRTLASQTTLLFGRSWASRRSQRLIMRKFHEYRRLYGEVEDPELRWSQPYVAMMAELMEELKPRDGA